MLMHDSPFPFINALKQQIIPIIAQLNQNDGTEMIFE